MIDDGSPDAASSPATAPAGSARRRAERLDRPERADDDELVMAFQRDRSRAAVGELLARHQGLVMSVAARYYVPGGDGDDVRQQAMIGFWKAVRDYRPAAGTSFTTFAHTCMKRQVITAVKAANRYKHGVLNDADRLDTPAADADAGRDTRADLPSVSHEQSAVDRLDLDGVGGMPVGLGSLEAMIERAGPDAVHELLRSHFAGVTGRGSRGDLSQNEAHVLVGLLSGRSYKEIAEEMERTPKFVDNTIQRIRSTRWQMRT